MPKSNHQVEVEDRMTPMYRDERLKSASNHTYRRILVTGGAGFIGANLTRLLVDRGYKVTVLDNLTAGRSEYLDGLPVEFIHGDILDTATIHSVIAEKYGVVHLAAQTGVPGSLRDPRKDCEINILGTLNVLEACRAEKARTAEQVRGAHASGPRVIFASSNAPLGRQSPPATEDKAPLPASPYGASKLAGEAYCLAYTGSWGLETVALRFGNVYGPFSAHKNSVIAKFFKDILTCGRVAVDGDGEQTRDFINVEDLCRAVLLSLESDIRGEIIQIATGVETSIQSLANLVREVARCNVLIGHGPERQGDIRRNYSDITKARTLLGWEPRVSLEQGLRTTWESFNRTNLREERGTSCTVLMDGDRRL